MTGSEFALCIFNANDDDLKVIGAIAAIITAFFGIFQYGMSKRNEFRRRFWEEQLVVYRKACCVAGSLASSSSLNDVEKQRLEFWSLYWGEMSILENKAVKEAMMAFGKQLILVQNNDSVTSDLTQLSYTLARECRRSLEQTWNPVRLDVLGDKPSLTPETKKARSG